MNALPGEFPNQSDSTKSNKNKTMMSEISQDFFFWGGRVYGFVFDKSLFIP